jgi:hypothetical protein
MSQSDTDYFRQRAQVEHAAAVAASNADAAAVHEALAKGYEALVTRAELRAAFRVLPGPLGLTSSFKAGVAPSATPLSHRT